MTLAAPPAFTPADEKWLRDLRRACLRVPRRFSCAQIGHIARLMAVKRGMF